MENKGWHPITFSYANAGPRQIKEIKVINTAIFLFLFLFFEELVGRVNRFGF